jgi:hypothetical protein
MNVTYTLALDSLNEQVASFMWVSTVEASCQVLFAITRNEWAEMGRPTTLTVEVKA